MLVMSVYVVRSLMSGYRRRLLRVRYTPTKASLAMDWTRPTTFNVHVSYDSLTLPEKITTPLSFIYFNDAILKLKPKGFEDGDPYPKSTRKIKVADIIAGYQHYIEHNSLPDDYADVVDWEVYEDSEQSGNI